MVKYLNYNFVAPKICDLNAFLYCNIKANYPLLIVF